MRIGDEVDVAVRLSNQLKQAVPISGDIKADGALQIQNGETAPQSILPAKNEQLWPLRLAAIGQATTGLLKVGLGAPDKIRVGGMQEFEIPVQVAALTQVFSSSAENNVLYTELPAQAQARQLTVRVNSGLLGAALQAAAMLVQYPYGCTEQLAHSTVPNLVLLDLVQRAGIKPEQLGSLAEVLNRRPPKCRFGHTQIARQPKGRRRLQSLAQ